MNRLYCAISLVLLPVVAAAAEPPTARELLDTAIRHHDPAGAWDAGAFRLVVEESRPDGGSRRTEARIDNASGGFELQSERDGDRIEGALSAEGCEWRVNESTEFSSDVRSKHGLTCPRLERMRNYYTYLWGMPMKLRDPGTVLGEVKKATFEGRATWELRVSYEEPVGSDLWYFYFAPESGALVGYRFYHDEAANDGEYITLDGEQEGGGLRLPKTRAWYTHKEDKYLGTDTLVSVSAER